MKSKAIAHPIQGLIKYHGMKDFDSRIPYHESISVCTAPLKTETEIEWTPDSKEDKVVIDGKEADEKAMSRCEKVIDKIREIANIDYGIKVKSENSFPSKLGFGSSSSGFAALTLAAAKGAKIDLDFDSSESREYLSRIARLGSGSAARSLTGGISKLKAGESSDESYSFQLAGPEDLEMSILCIPVREKEYTENSHREAVKSPLFDCRKDYIEDKVSEMEKAVENRDIESIGDLAETDTLNLHAVTMTTPAKLVLWKEKTVRIINKVLEWREEDDIPVHFSIDTGASVYLNTPSEHEAEVKEKIEEIGFNEIYECEIGSRAELID